MTNPFRAMCAELLNGLDELAHPRYPFPGYTRCAMDRARALLAQPEPEGPTDEDLTLTYAYAVAAAVDNKRGPFKQEEAEAAQLAGLRAVLAKWGNLTPQPPADGEVAELVETLKGIAYWRRHGKPGGIVPGFFDIRQADRLDRAAEILERFALPACLVINPDKEALAVSMAADLAGPGRIELLPDDAQIIKPAEHPQPVPVIERPWEREGWCDEQGRCWLRRKHEEDGVTWRLMAPASVFDDAMPIYYAEALPANALPTPRPPMDEITINLSSVPTSCRLTQPASKWRLARRNGEPILQAGIEWEDVPTASLDTTENTA